MSVVPHLLTSREVLLASPAKRRAPEKLFHPTQPPRARREIVAVSLPAGCWHTSTPRPRAAVGGRDAAKSHLPKKSHFPSLAPRAGPQTDGGDGGGCPGDATAGALRVALVHGSVMERNHLTTSFTL